MKDPLANPLVEMENGADKFSASRADIRAEHCGVEAADPTHACDLAWRGIICYGPYGRKRRPKRDGERGSWGSHGEVMGMGDGFVPTSSYQSATMGRKDGISGRG